MQPLAPGGNRWGAPGKGVRCIAPARHERAGALAVLTSPTMRRAAAFVAAVALAIRADDTARSPMTTKPRTNASFCAPKPETLTLPINNMDAAADLPGRWHSQFRQDAIVHALLLRKRGGFFIDLAANHPISISNTRTIERDFGWHGLCIEANPSYHAAHVRLRRCRLVACAIADTTGPVNFAFQGGVDSKDPAFGGLVGGNTDNKPRARGVHDTTHVVQAVRFDTVLQRTGVPNHFDFLSLDVEGAEAIVMRSFPWSQTSFGVLVVERPKNELIRSLRSHNYGFVCRTFEDEIWVHQPSLPYVRTVDLSKNGTRALPCVGLFQPANAGQSSDALRMGPELLQKQKWQRA